jgi:hypothetical protein
VYDIAMDRQVNLDEYVEGHHVEAVSAYAYGVCEKCLEKNMERSAGTSNAEKPAKSQKPPESLSDTSRTVPLEKGGETHA